MKRTGSSDYTPDEVAELDALRDEMVELQALEGARQAREAVIMHRVSQIAGAASLRGEASSRVSELPYRAVAADFAAALRISDRTVARMLGSGDTLVEEFSGTLAALAEGRIHRGHVSGIIDAGAHLPTPQARCAFEELVLPYAEHEAPGRVRAFARNTAERVHPSTFTERHQAATACRGLRVNDLPDGMSELIATLPTVVAHGVLDRVRQMARQVKDARRSTARRTDGTAVNGTGPRVGTGARAGVGAGVDPSGLGPAGLEAAKLEAAGQSPFWPGLRPDELSGELSGLRGEPGSGFLDGDARSIDEVRADIFADLLLTGDPAGHAHGGAGTDAAGTAGDPLLAGLGAITAHVQVTVPVLSLLGQADTPASLAGVGPIDADTARRLAGASSGWDRVLTDPISGAVLAVDRYTPSVQLRRTLQVRDQHCRFPGCRQPVHRSDIDHTNDYAHGGRTRENNLAHLCRGHHTLKHQTAWRVVQRPGGILEWTSPTGRVYPDVPTSSVMFKPEDEWNGHLARAGAGHARAAAEEPAPF